MNDARRDVLHLMTSGAVLTAMFGIAIATAKIQTACFVIGHPHQDVAAKIARLIRQWAAERSCSSVVAAGLSARHTHAAETRLGRQTEVLPMRRGVMPTPIPTVDILRSWAYRKLSGARINS